MPRPRSPRRHTRAQLRAAQNHLTRTLTGVAQTPADDDTVDVLTERLDRLHPTRRPATRPGRGPATGR